MAEPNDYGEVYAKWSIEHLPIIPESFRLKPVSKGTAQLKILKNLLNSNEVSEVVNCCDAGREGELIFRRIYKYCKSSKPIKRLWLSETTPAAVQQAFKHLKNGQDFDNLAAAAEARGQADWLVGINGTRAFTVRHGAVLSVGRVQTPTLNLMVTRENEIKNFTPVPYWELWATFQTDEGLYYKAKWFREKTDRLNDGKEALSLVDKITKDNGQPLVGQVVLLEQKEVKEKPPLLFNLNDLQKEGNRRYGFTAQQVLDIAQSLYEKHKLLTYPRTDSRHLSSAMVETIQDRLEVIRNSPNYLNLIPKEVPTLSKRHVDDGKITDHHAIIPTAINSTNVQLNTQEQKIFDLVVRRFLAIFYPDARYAITDVVTETREEKFKSRGRVELDAGWKIVWRDVTKKSKQDDEASEDEEQSLPLLKQGEKVSIKNIESLEKRTKPPKRFTEATLLAAMESAGRFVNDKEMADTLKATGGIGTPATRAAIIERLIKVGYITRDKKSLVPTAKGQILIALVPEQLKSVEMTAAWEDGLKQVEEGQQNAALWIKGIQEYTRELVELVKIQEITAGIKTDKKVLGKCPVCGREVVETIKSYGCTGYRDGCKFAVWKVISGKKISPKQAETLISKGKTNKIKGFKSKAGKSFDAFLVLGEGGKIQFDFASLNNAKQKGGDEKGNKILGKCPLCGKDVVENSRGFSCIGYRDGCKFTIWKEIAKKKITEKQALELITKGKTNKIKGFKSKAGKSFDAALVIENGQIKFTFAERV